MKSNRGLLFALAIPFFINSSFAEQKNVEQHLAEGNQYLTTGKFNDAIISFDAAIGKFCSHKFKKKKKKKKTKLI
jgi:predicted FMN-binding regulatory protein PaiB